MIEGVEAMEAVGDYFDAFLSDLTPARRKMVARKLGQRMRRLNTARIAKNVEPDGGPMAKRKPRFDRDGKKVRRGRMFRKLRLARQYEIHPSADGVELRTRDQIARLAKVHQFGLVDRVGRSKDGRIIRTRYERRRLLGFGDDDLDQITEELVAWLDND